MRIAIVIQGQEGVTWEDWLALAQTCEESGIETLLRSDHYAGFLNRGPDGGSLDAWGTTCALAARTERLRLGTLVSPVTFRHPAVLAKLVTTADRISSGRVEVGVGSGWHQGEHDLYGFPFPPVGERMNMLERQLRVLHEHADGKRYAPAPVQQPRPPILLGATGGPRGIAMAAEWADEYNSPNLLPAAAAERRELIARACEKRDRAPIAFSVMLGFLIGATEREFKTRQRGMFERFGRPPGDPRMMLTGTPEQVHERIREYERAGVDRLVLGTLLHRDLDHIALLGRTIAQEFAL